MPAAKAGKQPSNSLRKHLFSFGLLRGQVLSHVAKMKQNRYLKKIFIIYWYKNAATNHGHSLETQTQMSYSETYKELYDLCLPQLQQIHIPG